MTTKIELTSQEWQQIKSICLQLGYKQQALLAKLIRIGYNQFIASKEGENAQEERTV